MKAYHITNWVSENEVNKHGRAAEPGTSLKDLRAKPLEYLRQPVMGHSLGPDWLRMVKEAFPKGAGFELMVFGFYRLLLNLAADHTREYRGWILDERRHPMDAEAIQKHFMIHDLDVVVQCLKMLTDPTFDLVEYVEFRPDNSGHQRSFAEFAEFAEIREPFLNELNKKNINESIPAKAGDTESIFNQYFSNFDSVPPYTSFLQSRTLLTSMIPPKNEVDKQHQKKLLEMVRVAVEQGRVGREIYRDIFKAVMTATGSEIRRPMGKFINEMQTLGFRLRKKGKVSV